MALTMGQVAVAGTVAVFTVPPGPVSVTMFAAATGVFVGPGTPLTTANGLSVPTQPRSRSPASPGAGAPRCSPPSAPRPPPWPCSSSSRRPGDRVDSPQVAFVYGLLDSSGRVRYVGHARSVPDRLMAHWKKRNSKQRIRENPAFCAWLQGFLLPPDYRILATVPYSMRYQAERDWTIRLSKTCDLYNVSFGAAPLRRPG